MDLTEDEIQQYGTNEDQSEEIGREWIRIRLVGFREFYEKNGKLTSLILMR
jgi:hypothetical protein